MQHDVEEERPRSLHVRFGVDLQATRAGYRQAVWAAHPPPPPPAQPSSQTTSAVGSQQTPR